jgi:hypothetical protein
MTSPNVPRRSVAADLAAILNSPEVARLIDDLQETRLTGRPGYPIRSMVAMMLTKSLYALPTWTRTVALVREHPALAAGSPRTATFLPIGRATASRRSYGST